MCRFSDAGMRRLSTRCGGRRPKSANARSRGKLGTGWQRVLWGLYERGHRQALSSLLLRFLLFDRAAGFLRPDRRFRTPARAEAVKVGRHSAIEAHFDVSRPRLDSFEHGGRLDDCGPEERSVVEFLYLFSVCFGGCRLPVPASMSMSRAMIASAYIRQLRSGLPLCCMHGQSRR